MTVKEQKRCFWHLETPVCWTMRGSRTHLRLISFVDLILLCRYFNCSANVIEYKFWAGIKAMRGKL